MADPADRSSGEASPVRNSPHDNRRRSGSPTCDVGTSPPAVPPGFWETAEMRSALRSRHIGRVVRAYRQHRYHGYRGVTQEELAKWAGVSQGQVSRLETGRPLMRLDQLIRWSLLLGIPQRHLWFDLPERVVPRTAGEDG